MKKTLLLFAAVLSLALAGCEKSTPNSLSGTTWQSEETYTDDYYNYNTSNTVYCIVTRSNKLEFLKRGNATYTYQRTSTDPYYPYSNIDTKVGTFSYEHGHGAFKYLDEDGEEICYPFEIIGDKLYFLNSSGTPLVRM